MLNELKIFNHIKWYPVLFIFLLSLWFTGLGGEYSLNDDWMYASAVKSLVNERTYKVIGEFSPYIFLQVIFAWFLSLLYGSFSFVILRVSTLIWSLAGLYAMYKSVKLIAGDNTKAIFAALILLANPLFYNMSFSFMSEVPFVALLLLSAMQYILFVQKNKDKHRYLGALFSIMAFLVRQPGILLFLSFEFVFLKSKNTCRKCFLKFLIPISISILLYLGVELFLKPYLSLTDNYISVLKEIPVINPLHWFSSLLQRYLMMVYYTGLLLIVFFPAVIKIFSKEKTYRRLWFWFIVVFNAGIMLFLASTGRYFPFSGNVIYNFGLGVPLLADYDYLRSANFPHISVYLIMIFGLAIQIYSFLFFRLLARKVLTKFKEGNAPMMVKVIIIFLLFYTLLMFSFSFFDRYVLPVSVFVLLLVAYLYPAWLKLSKASLVLWILIFAYSLLGTKDYLNWNNAVLKEKNALLQKAVDRKDIFAGLSQNAWDTGSGKLSNQKYIFSWSEKKGYTVYKKIKYKRYLYGDNTILLLKK